MQYHIRSAEENDLSAIYHFVCLLEETKFDRNTFKVIFKSNISNEMYYYFIAEARNEIIGYISCHTQYLLHHCGKVAEIQELFVDEKHRKSGIGKKLVDFLEEKIRQHQCISLEVTAQNKRIQTHHFYQRAGFESTHQKFVKQLI